MRPYPAYKDSGVEWLGEVPEGWGLTPLRSEFDERTYKNDGLQSENYLSLVAGRGVMPYAEKGDMGNKMPEDLEKCKIVSRGNFVINSMNFGIGAFGLSAYDGICSPVYVVLDAKIPESLQFLNWIFQVRSFQLLAQSFGNGILAHRAAIGWDVLKVMPIPLPPLPEQQAIARFLDKEVAKIDALVAEQRRLIALLAEKRQAVISHAVTKGLNPATPLKPSGIDWLGDIPEGWEVKELKHLIADGTTITYGIVQAGPEYEGGIPYIRTSDMAGSKLPVSGYPLTSPEIEAAYERSRVFPGDIVVAIRATIGKALPVPDELLLANLTQGTAKISPGRDCLRDYLLFALAGSGAQTYFDLMAKGATFREITLDALRRLPLPIPPVLEQGEIAAFLRTQTTQFDALTTAATSAISLLQERRGALISAAVTGKIDLRAHFAQSLSEPETA